MVSETEIILAFLYKRSGKQTQTEPELYLTLSIELGWYTSDQAKQFVKQAKQNNLLKNQDQQLTPTFDIQKIPIPTGFKPSQNPIKIEKNETPTTPTKKSLLTAIAETTKQDQTTITNQIKKIQTEKHILFDVAALLYAKEKKINIQDYLKDIETKLFTIESEG